MQPVLSNISIFEFDDSSLRQRPYGRVPTSIVLYLSLLKYNSQVYNIYEPNDPCTLYPERIIDSENHCSLLLDLEVFQVCHDFVDPHSFIQFCKHDYCGCITTHGDDSCYCSAMAAYEVTCAKHGIHIAWRHLVPACQQNCGLGMTFSPCAAQDERACQALSYEHLLEVSRPFVDICVGGCVCANDQYLDVNGVCKPIEQCQCFWKGKFLLFNLLLIG